SVTFTLTSSPTLSAPYEISQCSGSVTASGVSTAFTGWNALSIGTPQSSGASFALTIVDSGYNASSNATSIGQWAVSFIPRGSNTQQAPFGNNASSALVTGNGGTMSPAGTFALPIPSGVKIQQLGNNVISAGWDWVVMVQINVPNSGTPLIQCFSSDPEMDVT